MYKVSYLLSLYWPLLSLLHSSLIILKTRAGVTEEPAAEAQTLTPLGVSCHKFTHNVGILSYYPCYSVGVYSMAIKLQGMQTTVAELIMNLITEVL